MSGLAATRRPLTPQDVTKEYFVSATPGQGTITYEDGYKIGSHQDEIAMTNLIHRTFGGDILLLKEVAENDKKRPDYLWRGALWELKGPSSINAADKRLQYAIEQIKDNPGGVILNMQGNVDTDALERQIARRMNRSKLDSFDLQLLQERRFYGIKNKSRSQRLSGYGVRERPPVTSALPPDQTSVPIILFCSLICKREMRKFYAAKFYAR